MEIIRTKIGEGVKCSAGSCQYPKRIEYYLAARDAAGGMAGRPDFSFNIDGDNRAGVVQNRRRDSGNKFSCPRSCNNKMLSLRPNPQPRQIPQDAIPDYSDRHAALICIQYGDFFPLHEFCGPWSVSVCPQARWRKQNSPAGSSDTAVEDD